jgi:hypothetical protein
MDVLSAQGHAVNAIRPARIVVKNDPFFEAFKVQSPSPA